MKAQRTKKRASEFKVWVVVDMNGNGYSMRHGVKDIPSVYEHKHNAYTAVRKALKQKKPKELFIFPGVVTYTV